MNDAHIEPGQLEREVDHTDRYATMDISWFPDSLLLYCFASFIRDNNNHAC